MIPFTAGWISRRKLRGTYPDTATCIDTQVRIPHPQFYAAITGHTHTHTRGSRCCIRCLADTLISGITVLFAMSRLPYRKPVLFIESKYQNNILAVLNQLRRNRFALLSEVVVRCFEEIREIVSTFIKTALCQQLELYFKIIVCMFLSCICILGAC